MEPLHSIVDPLGAGAEDLAPHLALEDREVVEPVAQTALDIFHSYLWVFLIAFLVTLLVTPVMRRLAIMNGVIDRPNDPRKAHRIPVAYLGGVAVWAGLMAALLFSYFAYAPGDALHGHESERALREVPVAILAGMTLITLLGVLDDIVGIDPLLKISGQLLAAAALAVEEFGTNVARGVLGPIGRLFGNEDLVFLIPTPEFLGAAPLQIDLIYWSGVAIIAVFVLGACNASNLIDGLDGLLSGVTAIAAAGLLIIALGMALADDGAYDGARVILCMALLGASLGFLPHNFNPASIFLGDAGSLLLGFVSVTIILSLGDTGKTPLVVAGLIIYAIPIIDTILAIFRRKLAGQPISAADDQHLHHMLKRSLGVKGAVLSLYGLGIAFAALGVLVTLGRARDAYTLAIVFVAFIAVMSIKVARRQAIERDAVARLALTETRDEEAPTGGASVPRRRDKTPARV
jgi:UDP-GlcNAc:undecaprenyl-phosphate GlcNAc-1-phosphate transferase